MSAPITVLSSPRGLLKLDASSNIPVITAFGELDDELIDQVTPLHFTELRYRDVVAVDFRGVTSVDASVFDFLLHLEQGAVAVRVIGASGHIQRELTPSELDHTYFEAA